MKLICPSCGSVTSFNPVWVTTQGILEDQSSKLQTFRGKVSVNFIEPYEYGVTQYGILWCGACGEHIVVEKDQYASEDDWRVVYPITRKIASKEIPEPIKSEFEEACLCLAMGAYRAGVSMCQIALEALWREQKVPDLQALYKQGTISKQLCERANEIRRWGNVAKHEPIPDVVSEEDVRQLLTYLDAILDHVYVQPASLDALKQKRKEAEQKPS